MKVVYGFFFNSVTGLVKINPTVIPTRRVASRATRSGSNTNVTVFVSKNVKTPEVFFYPHSENTERSR